MGEHDTMTTKDGPTQDISVIKAVEHPKYNLPIATNDIAVLTLAHDVKFTGIHN